MHEASVKITTDSTSDLSPALLERYHITPAPLYIVMGDKEFRDGLDIKPADIYRYVDSTGEITKTSAVPVSDYQALFSSCAKQGREVVHINISHHMSACYQNALIAAKEVGNVYVVDSLSLSTGSGHAAVEAAQLAEQGLGGAEIKRRLDTLVPRISASFVIDTLKYLHKGGRCSSVAALGANLLKLRPCIEVIDGKMTVGKKYRGAMDKVVEEYIRDRLDGKQDTIDPRRIFITHTASKELTELACKAVRRYMDFDEILVTDAGCTISNHCGPGTLGILYIYK